MFEYKEGLDAVFAVNMVCTLCLIISLLVDVGNSFTGFTGMLFGALWVAYLPIAYYVVRISPGERVAYGIVLGLGIWLVVLTLMEAIYYGQVSNCSSVGGVRRALLSAECAHPAAQKSACVFSVFLFLGGGVLQVLLLKHKDVLLPNPSALSSGSAYDKVAVTDL